MKRKIYRVGFGMLVEGEDYNEGMGSYNIIAIDAKEAIAKADLLLDSGVEDGERWVEAFESVEYVLTIDVE